MCFRGFLASLRRHRFSFVRVTPRANSAKVVLSSSNRVRNFWGSLNQFWSVWSALYSRLKSGTEKVVVYYFKVVFEFDATTNESDAHFFVMRTVWETSKINCRSATMYGQKGMPA